ncbi:MAG: ABC transporter ATP-binding protein [Microthrixaceae bacterium]
MSARVHVEGATVRFATAEALAGVDLEVACGEVVAVLGPSGSGKSTLLRAIAGLQRLDSGRVWLDDRDVSDVPPHRRGVGLMFQDHALFPHRDVAGNVAFGLKMQRRPTAEIQRRVEHLLELVDLPGYGDRAIHTLSGGEQQRVALARALAPEPKVLLLDEPLGALDRSLRDHLAAELRALFTRLGLTVLAVTHDESEAFSMADRVVILDRGSILQAGSAADVWARPRSVRVAEILGFRNLLQVVVAAGRARTPWGELSLPDARDGVHSVLVRPMGVHLAAATDGGGATVMSASFAGDRVSVQLAVDGGPGLWALVPLRAGPTPGDVVAVTIDADAVVTLEP